MPNWKQQKVYHSDVCNEVNEDMDILDQRVSVHGRY